MSTLSREGSMMEQYMFTSEEINSHSASAAEWHEFVRRREAQFAMQGINENYFKNALEIGAGNGGQSVVLAKFCRHLVCTEVDPLSHAWQGQTILERSLPNVEYRLCDAENLSDFGNECFDLIFSSNVLEHIGNIDVCLSECYRVLKPDGLMLHAMPSRCWKFFKVLLSPFALRVPKIHGVSSTHWQEFMDFGRDRWIRLFSHHGFEVRHVKRFPFYFGHGPRFVSLLKLGNHLAWPGSYLYVLRRSAVSARR
jgi:ubiquinone/menaquinone biosynthesis C-methylase UbiE